MLVPTSAGDVVPAARPAEEQLGTNRKALIAVAAGTKTMPFDAAGVMKWWTEPTLAEYNWVPVAGSRAYSTPLFTSTYQTAPPDTMGAPAHPDGWSHRELKLLLSALCWRAWRPSMQGTKM